MPPRYDETVTVTINAKNITSDVNSIQMKPGAAAP